MAKRSEYLLLKVSTREGSTIGARRHHYLYPPTHFVLVVAKCFTQESLDAVPDV